MFEATLIDVRYELRDGVAATGATCAIDELSEGHVHTHARAHARYLIDVECVYVG